MQVAAIIVTFQPNLIDLNSLIKNISDELYQIVVFDNASACYKGIEQIALENEKISFVRSETNKGIAYGQNRAVEKLNDTITHFLLLDQDSVVPVGSISRLLADFSYFIKQNPAICAVSATIVNPDIPIIKSQSYTKSSANLKNLIQPLVDSINFFESIPISSGLLIDKSIFSTVGPFNESFFIDLVDTEWYLRARSKGFCFELSKNSLIVHVPGVKKSRGRFSSPHRAFYQLRNSIYFLKLRHGRPFFFASFFKYLYHHINACLHLDSPLWRFFYILKGIICGCFEVVHCSLRYLFCYVERLFHKY